MSGTPILVARSESFSGSERLSTLLGSVIGIAFAA